jgi:hypothetical protein
MARAGTASTAGTDGGAPGYKVWLVLEGRKFLVESIPLLDLADDLAALSLMSQASPNKSGAKTMMAMRFTPRSQRDRAFPPARAIGSDTNQLLLAATDSRREPGVVLDYQSIITSLTNYTFAETQPIM